MFATAAKSFSPTETRLALLENGYWPLPVGKGKHPPFKTWQKTHADAGRVRQWAADHPRCLSTGVLTGDVVAVDIDALDPKVAEKLISRLLDIPDAGQAPCRTGKAPKCMFFFRAEKPQEKAATPIYHVNGLKCQIEVMGVGQQVVTHGIHDETGKPYQWTGGDLAFVPLTNLPIITPDAIASYIDAATEILAASGYPEKKTPPAQKPVASRSETVWQRVNAAALAAADAWVPVLFNGAHKESGTGAWRVSSKELGRNLEEDISIHPDGVRDFGEEKPSTPIQLVRDYGDASSPKDALLWLCQQMGRDPAELGWEKRQPVSVKFGAASAPLVADNDDVATDIPPGETETAAGLPDALCYPPGAVGEFVRYITACARFPSPHLALVSALALTAGLVGRRYKGPTGLRSNLYVVGLAESGFGKDITIRAAEALSDSTSNGTKVSQHLFSDKLRSLPGLANRLKKSPSCISVIDEFGKFLGLHTGRGVAPHREEITTALMELTGAPQGSWGGQEKAGGNIPRIVQPCLTIHGISTPSTFWGALSSGNIEEGLLARLVVIDTGTTEPRKVRQPPASLDDVPEELAAIVADLLGGDAGRFGHGTFHALAQNSEERPWPMVTAEFAPGVDDLFEGFDDRMRAMRGNMDPQFRPILNRVGENAARLALIVAIGCDPKEPVITAEIQKWANAVAEASFYTIIRGARENIADNERSAEYLRVRNMIARAGGEGLTRGVVDRRLRGAIDERRLDDIFSALQRASEIKFGRIVSESGQTRIRYWSTEHWPEEAQPL